MRITGVFSWPSLVEKHNAEIQRKYEEIAQINPFSSELNVFFSLYGRRKKTAECIIFTLTGMYSL